MLAFVVVALHVVDMSGTQESGAVTRTSSMLVKATTHFLLNEDNGNDNGHSFSELSVHKAVTCPMGQSAWDVAPPWLANEIHSVHRRLKQNVPLRPLAARNQVVLHLCWRRDVLHSVCVCHDTPRLLLFRTSVLDVVASVSRRFTCRLIEKR